MNHDDMTRAELISYIHSLETDHAFGILNRAAAFYHYPIVKKGKVLIMMDICNMHGANHAFGSMQEVDNRIKFIISQLRQDEVFRYGGDEICILLNESDILGFINRLDTLFREQNLYAVYGITISSQESLESMCNRLDTIIMGIKSVMDTLKLRPNRQDEYKLLPSQIAVV